MSYLIAVASSDGKNTDLKFGEAREYLIYRAEGKNYELLQIRKAEGETVTSASPTCAISADCLSGCGGAGAGAGCGGAGAGCGGEAGQDIRVELLGDCRAVVCKKIGFKAVKSFEKRAISVFDIEADIGEVLDKITSYYDKVDNHRSLREKSQNE